MQKPQEKQGKAEAAVNQIANPDEGADFQCGKVGFRVNGQRGARKVSAAAQVLRRLGIDLSALATYNPADSAGRSCPGPLAVPAEVTAVLAGAIGALANPVTY